MAINYTDAQIRKLFPTYFDAAATATQVDEDVIRKILKMYSTKEGGRTYIGKKLKLDQSVIGRVLDKAFEKNILKKVPVKEFKTSIAQRMYDDISTRKIYKEIRPVRDQDFYQWTGRGKKPPVGSKFKIVFPYPDNPNNTVVPKKFQGVQFYKTEALAKAAKAEEAAFDTKALRAEPYNQAVKDIHKIALKNADDINDVDELAQAIYGKAKNTKDLLSKQKLIANDLVRYQEFLLGFKTIPGVAVPTGKILDEIISEFPPENQWGKFARGKIRDSQLKIRDQLLKTKGPKLRYLRDNIVKFIDSGAMELDESMGIAATYERAPGYTELGQVIKKSVNAEKNRRIDQPFSRLFEKVTQGETGLDKEIKDFNQISKNFQKKWNVDTPIIEYRPGESLDASKFVKHFDKLSPEAQVNVKELAGKGIALRSKAMPMGQLFNIFKEGTAKEQFTIATTLKCVPGNADGGRIGYALGSGAIKCVETKLATETEIPKLTQLDDSSPGLSKMKNAATGFLNFVKKGGKFGAIAAAGAAGAGLVKTFMNDDPTTFLSDENQQKNMLIEMLTGPVDEAPRERSEILDWQLPVLGGAAVAGTAAVAPSTIEASRSARFGKKPSGLTKTGLKTLGRGLSALGTPLGMLAYEPFHIGEQIAAGDSPAEMATNPWNYAGLAFADDLTRMTTKGLGPTASKIMRLGISPAALRIGSRFLGLPGLALSLGISGYETYDDWKKKRGWFSEE